MKSILMLTSLALGLLLAACGGDNASNGGRSATSPEVEGDSRPVGSSVNPVDVLKKVPDCKIGAGVESGEPDMNGNLYASCTIEDVKFKSEGVYFTDVDVTARAVNPADAMALGYGDIDTDDSHKVIFGNGFYLVLTADPAVFGTGAVDAEKIAAAVDGQVS